LYIEIGMEIYGVFEHWTVDAPTMQTVTSCLLTLN